MKKKILSFLLMFTVLLTPVLAQAKGFSGGRSSVHSSSSVSRSGSISSSGTYHSGYKSPSSSVRSQQPSYHSNSSVGTVPVQSKRSSLLSHAAAFGAGALLGSMLHPFGTHAVGAVGGTGFSFSGLLMDVILILIVVWIGRRIFGRR